MGFVLGVLVVGALLSIIFGRRAGAMFVTGTFSIVAICLGVLLLLLSPLIYGFFTAPSPPESSERTSYQSPSNGASYPTPPSGNAYSPVAPLTAPVYQANDASSTDNSSLPIAPRPGGATVGVTTQPADSRLSAQFSMSPGYGAQVVSVVPSGPAEQAGLMPGDFIQAMDSDPITADHTLSDYGARKGAGQPIRLSVQHNDGSRWLHEWVKVTPR